MVKNLNDFWFQLFRQELIELWCLLIWFTWTIVNAYWSIGPLQSLVLKEHWWLLDIQYSPQDIDGSLKWFKLVHFDIWLWHLKNHGHNATLKQVVTRIVYELIELSRKNIYHLVVTLIFFSLTKNRAPKKRNIIYVPRHEEIYIMYITGNCCVFYFRHLIQCS